MADIPVIPSAKQIENEHVSAIASAALALAPAIASAFGAISPQSSGTEPKPGAKSSELWTSVGGIGLLLGIFDKGDPKVAMLCITGLVALFVISRTLVKIFGK